MSGDASNPRSGPAGRLLWMGCLSCLEVLREAHRGWVCQSCGSAAGVTVSMGVEQVEEGLRVGGPGSLPTAARCLTSQLSGRQLGLPSRWRRFGGPLFGSNSTRTESVGAIRSDVGAASQAPAPHAVDRNE